MGIISDICKDNGIKLKVLTDEVTETLSLGEKGVSGWAVRADDKKYIFCDMTKNRWHSSFVASHELAHILFEHLTPERISSNDNELEANIFAATLTALILWDEYRSSKD